VNENELRAIVRDAVARHLGPRAAGSAAEPEIRGLVRDTRTIPPSVDHPSHAIYVNVVNVDDSCVIEPGVRCNHCNYCKSHGH
jgi:hypothetical protein